MRTLELGTLDQLLDFALESLDVPKELQARATAVYDDLAAWVMKHDAAAGRKEPGFYPQGSAALGTTTMNNGDWDIDAVHERPIARTSTTQAVLKAQAKEMLEGFREDQRRQSKPVPRIEERPRCWRLHYRGFHIDALPAIPEDVDDDSSTRLLISDREQYAWIVTDPKGYIAWFILRMGDVFEREREMIAKASYRAAEDVPLWEVKTVLQRTVQYVRRHRDLFYGEDLEKLCPASILVTTLVARCYEGEESIAEALRGVALRLRDHLHEKDGTLWVPNPTDDHLPEDERENLARAMADDSRRFAKFELWIRNLCADLLGLRDARGPGLRKLIAKSIGDRPTVDADERVAKIRTEQRDAGALRMTSHTATLGAIGAVAVPRHTFDGVPPQ
jgi:Cyclic GMP-AMP synthase DncV-like, nucleotidyltransferase domain